MSDSYVTSKATLKCSFGDKTSKLTVYPDRTVFLTGKPMANISDHISLYNIPPFGRCHTTRYPATGAATAANKGKLTPMPCIPGTVSDWINGKDDYLIKGEPALLKSSYCRCKWGGVITITDDGQVDTGSADLSRESAKTEDEMKAEACNINFDDSEDKKQKENKFAVDDNTEEYNSSHAEYLKRETKDIVSEKDILYTKKLQTKSLNIEPFDKNNIDIEKQSDAEIKHVEYLSKYKNDCKHVQKWLAKSFPEKLKDNLEPESDNAESNTPLFKLGINEDVYLSDFYVETIRDATQIADTGNLDLKFLDSNPCIKNSKTTLRITFDIMFASLSIGLSLGVDSDWNKYFQLNLHSYFGGDYSDILSLPYAVRKRKFKKLAKKILRRKAFVKIEPEYRTNVNDPMYDWWEGGFFVDLDLKLDKMLQVKIYNENHKCPLKNRNSSLK